MMCNLGKHDGIHDALHDDRHRYAYDSQGMFAGANNKEVIEEDAKVVHHSRHWVILW
jgi:hypothetical protein